MEPPGWMYEEDHALVEGSIETTPGRKPSANPAEPIKKTRLFSLVNSSISTAATVVTRSGSTQLDVTAPSFYSSQNLNTADPFIESDYPSQGFRPETYEEKSSADAYYSSPPTFVSPESIKNMKVQDQSSLTTTSSEAQVREARLPVTYKANFQNLSR